MLMGGVLPDESTLPAVKRGKIGRPKGRKNRVRAGDDGDRRVAPQQVGHQAEEHLDTVKDYIMSSHEQQQAPTDGRLNHHHQHQHQSKEDASQQDKMDDDDTGIVALPTATADSLIDSTLPPQHHAQPPLHPAQTQRLGPEQSASSDLDLVSMSMMDPSSTMNQVDTTSAHEHDMWSRGHGVLEGVDDSERHKALTADRTATQSEQQQMEGDMTDTRADLQAYLMRFSATSGT